MEKSDNFIRGGRLQREEGRFVAKPSQHFHRVLVTVAQHELFRQRPLRGEGPFFPNILDPPRADWTFPEPGGQPQADRRCLLDPVHQVIGIVGAHFFPDALSLLGFGPLVLLRPMPGRDEHKRGIGWIERRWILRSLTEVLGGLLSDFAALATNLPSCFAARNVVACGSRGCPAIPTGVPHAPIGWEA